MWDVVAAGIVGLIAGLVLGVPIGVALESSWPARHSIEGPDCDGD